MARSFGPETAVLSYRPRAHVHPGGRNDRAWLLWPSWAFRVVAPEFRKRRINVLQQAVLGVLQGSRLNAAELGERLGVHPELAAFVVGELQIQGRVDGDWNITERGKDLLEEEREESAQLVPGWVFRDPWSGSLWPFVASTLEYARTEPGDTGFPVLDLGTTGRPWRQSAWMQMPPRDTRAVAPEPREILRASVRHGRLERRARRVRTWVDEGDEGSPLPGQIDLNRIAVIEPEPEPVFLVTYLYVPRDGDENGLDWHACDFFGRGSSPELRRLVARVAADEELLARAVDRILGQSMYGSFEEFRRATAAREMRAQSLLENALTIDVHRHAVAQPLAEVADAWLELKELGDDAAQWRRRGVMTSCRRALERLLKEIAERWPLSGLAESMSYEDQEVNAALLTTAATTVGLQPIPEPMLRVPRKQVRAVCDFDDAWRLRPLVVATLLRARDEEQHPLRAAAAKAPDLLERIDDVTARSGEAVHDNDRELTLREVDRCVEDTLVIVGWMLGLPARSFREVLRNG